MPIYKMLQNAVFEPEHIRVMGTAFEETLSVLGLTNRDDELVEMVAKKIIELGQQGERDPQRLRDLAIMAFTA